LKVLSSAKETTGLNKKTTYAISCKDKSGSFEITRFYHEFVLLREKLLLRWPGCFIPSVPTKKFGNNPYELVLIRMKVLNNFLKYLSKVPEIYYSTECGTFFRHDEEYAVTNGKLIDHEL
jgi:sorting nexin-1/2